MFRALIRVGLGKAIVLTMIAGCSSAEAPDDTVPSSPDPPGSEEAGGTGPSTPAPSPGPSADEVADVTGVRASGSPEAYTFSVTVRSPDTGCDQYADWWEVLTPEGELVYRRILAHSHVDEQPFTRSGGPVPVGEGDRVVVRAHMNDAGYGGVAFAGSVASGFAADTTVSDRFAPTVAEIEPLPTGCAF